MKTPPPPLSPAAQAVLDAFLNGYICKSSCNVAFEADRNGIAAALQAAADQVVPEPPKNWDLISPVAAREREIRKNLIAIAAELKGGND
jgi:hypothetical protein